MRQPTALLIPCPWSGDDNDARDWRYACWYWLYRNTRALRHRFGLHDWLTAYPDDDVITRCSWCGLRSEFDREATG